MGLVNLNLPVFATMPTPRAQYALRRQGDDGAITGDGNFDAAGNLLVPMRDSGETDGAVVTLEPIAVPGSYTVIRRLGSRQSMTP